MDRCDNCRFSEFNGTSTHAGASEYQCRYNPPIVGEDNRAQWPIVFGHDWCGKFEVSIEKVDPDVGP